MQIENVLERLGYNHNEVTVYLAVLHAGETSIAFVAKKTNLPRSTAKLVVEHLHKKGLLNSYLKQKRQVWIAENPNKFLLDLQEKEAILREILPELQSLRHESKDKPILRYYQGNDRISLIFDEVLTSQYPVMFLGSIEHIEHYLGEERTEMFIDNLFARAPALRLLTAKSDFVMALKSKITSGKKQIHFCDDPRVAGTIFIIFNSRVAVIVLNEIESIGVIYEDIAVRESMTALFEALWENSLQ